MTRFSVTWVILSAGCTAALAAGPTPTEFSALHSAQCEDHAAHTRNVRCRGYDEEPTEFGCRYELPEEDGSWKGYDATVARDGGKWVWLAGETRCSISGISNLT